MDAVTLKGRKAGFELQLNAAASIAEVLDQLRALLTQLAKDTPEGELAFMLETGDRLFDEEAANSVKAIFAEFPRFSIDSVHANVANQVSVKQQLLSHMTHLDGSVIRSGQLVEYTGDVLFLGDLHQGGTLRTTGSIFTMGHVNGLLIAGANGDTDAVIGGDISEAGQIRIADTIEVIEKNDYSAATLSFINDLHMLEHGEMTQLNKLRPKLFRKLEDL